MRLKSHSALCPQLEAWANTLEEVLTDSPIPRKGVRKKTRLKSSVIIREYEVVKIYICC